MAGTITRRQTILLEGNPEDNIFEYEAGEDNILPGMILQINSDGEVITNNEATKHAEMLVALEDDFLGMNIDGVRPDSSDIGYQEGDKVRCKLMKTGDAFWGILKDGETATIDEYGTSNADGKFQVAGATEYWSVKFETAAAPSGADARIKCRVI